MNTITGFFEKQLKDEAEITRKILKIIPEDNYDWKPHPKSMTIRRLAAHLAELPGWVPMAIDTDVLDFSANDYKATPFKDNIDLLSIFEENQKKAEVTLTKTTDEFLQNIWTMKDGDQVFMSATKEYVIRMALSQTVHHRAQMGVFLRLLNIPIPGSYGPSADEMGL
jgi:uncharacterized damage-inducible protein DinB